MVRNYDVQIFKLDNVPIKNNLSKYVGPEMTPQDMASNQGLQCLPLRLLDLQFDNKYIVSS